MKFLLLLAIVVLLVWQWRHARVPQVRQARRRAEQQRVQPMVACAHCGLHLPEGEAVAGARGHYCSAAHRQAREP